MEVNKIISYKFYTNNFESIKNLGPSISKEICLKISNVQNLETEHLSICMNRNIAMDIYKALKNYFDE